MEELASFAKRNISSLFNEIRIEKEEARVWLSDIPVTIMPIDSIVRSLFTTARILGEEGAKLVTYEIGKETGFLMALQVVNKFNLVNNVVERILHGPLLFEASGLGHVNLLKLNAEEDFLILWESPNSVFAEAYIRKGIKEVTPPLCNFYAGYSAGWCEACVNIPLEAREVWCRAEEGRDSCRFVISHPQKLYEHMKNPENLKPSTEYSLVRVRF